MKFLFKYTFHLAILACVSALFSGCEQDPKYRVYDYPVPVVESIYPTDGYVTTQVVITGTNFGDRAEAVKVSSVKPNPIKYSIAKITVW